MSDPARGNDPGCEGHQYEPMRDYAEMTAAERALGYHNPADGAYRLRQLADLLARL